MPETRWYFSRDGEQFGPVSGAELKGFAATGELLPGDLVWKEGAADWKPAGDVRGLFAGSGEPSSADQPAHDRWAELRATGAERFERYAELTSGGLWEDILNRGRQRFSTEFLESMSRLLTRWGASSLFVAMFLLPAYLVIVGFRQNETSMFAIAAGAFVLLAVVQYIARRMIDTVLLLVEGTPSRIAGTAFLDILAHLFLLLAAGQIAYWVFNAILDEAEFSQSIFVVAGACTTFYRAALCLHPRMTATITSEPTSLGEEAVGVTSALLKVVLRSVPVDFGFGCVIGTTGLVVAFILSFLGSDWQDRAGLYAVYSGYLVAFASTWPLFLYLVGIFSYVILDVIRSILILPSKIDRLADAQSSATPEKADGP